MNERWQLSEEHQPFIANFFEAAGLPRNMALFWRLEGNSPTLYVTPAAETFAKAIEARPCDKPEKQGLTLYIGHRDAWNLFD